MWRELVLSLDAGATFSEGATTEQIAELAATIGVALPNSLKSLLAESDGICGSYGVQLIWPVAAMKQQNVVIRTEQLYQEQYIPLNHYLFFADAGDGELFGFGIVKGSVARENVYVWNPVDDGRTWVAPSLKLFLEWWLTGKMQI